MRFWAIGSTVRKPCFTGYLDGKHHPSWLFFLLSGCPNYNREDTMLIILGGLPGVGKTTLAKAVAREWEAVYLRVDTIEQALRFSEALQGEVGPAGYLVA